MLPAYRTTAATRAWAILVVCAVACVVEPDDLLLIGEYGGDGIGLVATTTEAWFMFRCAHGHTGPLRLGPRDGVARAKGTGWNLGGAGEMPFRVDAQPIGSMTLDLTVRFGDGPSLSFEARLDTPPDVAAICWVAGAS